jgi:tetratricopeptide (TPR) repeat protein
MRLLPILALAWFGLCATAAVAQTSTDPGDLYLDGFRAWQEGESLEKQGNKQGAAQKYIDAHKVIQTVAHSYPEWQPGVATYRLKILEDALVRLGYKPPVSMAAAPALVPAPLVGAAPVPPMPVAPGTAAAPAPGAAGVTNPLDVINQQFNALQQQNAAKDQQLNDMAAKMKGYEAYYIEALNAKQKAEGERDALLQEMKNVNNRLSELTNQANARDAAAQTEIQNLRTKSQMLSDMLASRTKEFDDSDKAIETLQKERDDLLATKKQLEDELVKERSTPKGPVTTDQAKLLAENARLKLELDGVRKHVQKLEAEGVRKDGEIAALKTQVTGIQSEIAKLRQENTGYQAQVADLTKKLKEMNSGLQRPTNGKPDSQLARENETLRQIIMRHLRQQQRLLASKELVIAEMKKLEFSSQSLLENLEDMTSGKVRITVDEEDLFNQEELKVIIASKGSGSSTLEGVRPKSATASGASAKSGGPGAPSAASVAANSSITPEEKLMVQADLALQGQDFKAAEKALQDALRANPKNTTALVSLARIKLSERKEAEAEVFLKKCLDNEPNSGMGLYWLGVCQFQQSRLPDALGSFEKCVLSDKKNARAHHYLGIISDTMKNRRRAEAEFKSALAIDPEYGDAYFNLAILYATANPPDYDKAREHYQNALRRGVSADEALEKLLNPSPGPQGSPAEAKPQEKTAAR